ncbi:hypothetical protein Glove_311g60 [Diversispora epigaea]|uniref:Protein kinase domain-containing protein n=1 Tax=Diversispora epigaea TaxID=1348612 RepID=A0A397HRI7_9GLOM|nr:hypothetical protein Glove_311g60 [Diversispora epigaea]
MSQEKGIFYCPAGHSYNNYSHLFHSRCNSCTNENFSREFGTWSSGNVEIDKAIQKSQKNHQEYYGNSLQWIPYNNFRDIKHIADGGYGSVCSAILKNGIKKDWDFNKQDWEYSYVGSKVALKEINDSRHDISKFLREVCYFYLDYKLF